MIDYAWHNIVVSQDLTQDASSTIRKFISAIAGNTKTPCDQRTASGRLEKQTGLTPIYYDCCPNSCMSYSMNAALEECPICQHPRWQFVDGCRQAYSRHVYIPIIHRLCLWYSNAARAETLVQYRKHAESRSMYTDFWNGSLYRDILKKKRLCFQNDTDLGFFASADGMKVFKTRKPFNTTPLILVRIGQFNISSGHSNIYLDLPQSTSLG
ncbi:hypothetical protein EDC01DRAFT_611109 [Geopyxis carbonaria]|nr:hypothetical protein EDC01DRAFT_611109 [Geopyxis carbonaria]